MCLIFLSSSCTNPFHLDKKVPFLKLKWLIFQVACQECEAGQIEYIFVTNAESTRRFSDGGASKVCSWGQFLQEPTNDPTFVGPSAGFIFLLDRRCYGSSTGPAAVPVVLWILDG